jgi:hypothetical protein
VDPVAARHFRRKEAGCPFHQFVDNIARKAVRSALDFTGVPVKCDRSEFRENPRTYAKNVKEHWMRKQR